MVNETLLAPILEKISVQIRDIINERTFFGLTNDQWLTLGLFLVSAAGVGAAIWYYAINLKKQNQIQKDTLLHDMVKEEISNWKYLHKQKKYYKEKRKNIPKSVKSHIFNYYEYLAHLIKKGKIDEEEATTLWKPNIYGMYDDFKEEFLGKRRELKHIYHKWKSEEDN